MAVRGPSGAGGSPGAGGDKRPSHVVRSGQTLAAIAAEHGVSVEALKAANPQIPHPDLLQPGETIRLPGPGVPAPAVPFAPGGLSARYESNGSPGTVSSGAGDAGGVSYGAYQITTANVRAFVADEGARWPQLQRAPPGSATFGAAWRAAAASDPAAFGAAQRDYIGRTHYAPQVRQIRQDTEVDVTQRSHALQDVVWSTAVQHGGGTRIVSDAIRAVQARGLDAGDPGFDAAVIDAVYAERGRKGANGQLAHFIHDSPAVQRGVAARFVAERAQALAELAAQTR